MHVRVATILNGNEGIGGSIGSLPLNATTNVRVEAFGRALLLFFNNTFDSMVTVSADRISGAATLYISDPWYTPASASFGSYQMKSITALTPTASNLTPTANNLTPSASKFNVPLSQLAINEKTTVPANFALSFDIKPFGISSESTSIIHYSRDNTDGGAGGRMPGIVFSIITNLSILAIWFVPGTTKLYVRVSTTANRDAGIGGSIASLPLNVMSFSTSTIHSMPR